MSNPFEKQAARLPEGKEYKDEKVDDKQAPNKKEKNPQVGMQNKPERKHQEDSCRKNSSSNQMSVAHAPYNFVPLQEQILAAPLNKAIMDINNKQLSQQAYAAFLQQEGLLSGYITLDIETMTPTFIGGQGTDFYKVGDKYAIPGSSLRGMIKNYLKITTLGAMHPAENEDMLDRRIGKSSIGEHVPTVLKAETIDFADSLFGKKELWSSRLSFEDALLSNDKVPGATKWCKPLMEPKPTSFQLYLEQDTPLSAKHWDVAGVNIRGYKMYWHKEIEDADWQDKKPNKKLSKEISPIPSGAKFNGKIHFDRLTPEELGALLQVVSFNEPYLHKIGMGKPLGLGSIKINAKLYISNLTKRYSNFIAEQAWHDEQLVDAGTYIEKITEYANANMNNKSAYTNNLDNLKILMRWNSINKAKAIYALKE